MNLKKVLLLAVLIGIGTLFFLFDLHLWLSLDNLKQHQADFQQAFQQRPLLTGGGFFDNIPRVLPDALACALNLDAIPVLPIFKWLAKEGGVAEAEMLRS